MVEDGMARARITTERACGMRYVGQSWDLIVALPGGPVGCDALADLFHAAHERRFGYRMSSAVEIVSFRLAVIGAVRKPDLPDWPDGGTVAGALRDERDAWFGGAMRRVPVFDRERLPRGARLDGAAVIEEMGAVTVIPPGWTGEVGRWGEIHLRRARP
jgi:N-methylhydantoinase A